MRCSHGKVNYEKWRWQNQDVTETYCLGSVPILEGESLKSRAGWRDLCERRYTVE